MDEITRILSDIQHGEPDAASRLLPLVYEELRRLAAQKLKREAAGQTLQPTALVHEAYLRIAGRSADAPWEGRRHFFGAAAEAMRRILIESARRKKSQKYGGDLARHDLVEDAIVLPDPCEDVLALDDALERLAQRDPIKAELVKLRYFAAMTGEEAAAALDISTATADRYWAYARAWLHQEVTNARSSSAD